MKLSLPVAVVTATLAGCMSAQQHRSETQDDSTERLTVGTVQKEIRVGMSSAEVASVLGSPNVLSTDEERREVWIYDKFATDVTHSTSAGGLAALVFAGGGSGGGAVAAGGGRSAGATSTSQRTLTVVIKLDENERVRDFAYHTSRF